MASSAIEPLLWTLFFRFRAHHHDPLAESLKVTLTVL
jgi:hypothetical protein